MNAQEAIKTLIDNRVSRYGLTYDRATGQVVSADKFNREYMTRLQTTLASLKPEDIVNQAKKITDAWEAAPSVKGGSLEWGNPKKIDDSLMHALCAVRIENINNFIVSMPSFLNWYFEEVSLAPDEQAYVVNETKNEVSVGFVGEDGTPQRQRLVRPQSKYSIELRSIASETVRYKTLDVYRGDVSQLTKATFDIARDLRIKIDLEHFDLLNKDASDGGAFGAFSYDQSNSSPEQRIFVAHSRLRTEHFPTTNDYDLTADPLTAQNPMTVSTASFDIPVLQAILDYAARWGDLFEGGALVPTGEILVPASDIIAIAEKFTPTANVAEQKMQSDINTNGYTSVSYLGKNWRFVPSLFLPKGTCYPRFNLMPGMSFFKTGLDREFVETNLREHWEERGMQKVYGAAIINQRRIRALRIKYAGDGSSS